MPDVPLEDAEGEALKWRLLEWLIDEDDPGNGILEFSHIANETGTASKMVQVRKTKQGMRKGVPDYVCIIQRAKRDRVLVWIELKRRKGPRGRSPSVVSEEQEKWVRLLNTVPNVAAHFAFGHEQAAEILR